MPDSLHTLAPRDAVSGSYPPHSFMWAVGQCHRNDRSRPDRGCNRSTIASGAAWRCLDQPGAGAAADLRPAHRDDRSIQLIASGRAAYRELASGAGLHDTRGEQPFDRRRKGAGDPTQREQSQPGHDERTSAMAVRQHPIGKRRRREAGHEQADGQAGRSRQGPQTVLYRGERRQRHVDRQRRERAELAQKDQISDPCFPEYFTRSSARDVRRDRFAAPKLQQPVQGRSRPRPAAGGRRPACSKIVATTFASCR